MGFERLSSKKAMNEFYDLKENDKVQILTKENLKASDHAIEKAKSTEEK